MKFNFLQDNAMIIATIIIGICGTVITAIMPIMTGAFVDDLGLSINQASFVIAAEMGGMGLGTLAISFKVHIWNRRHLALIALTFMLAGNLSAVILEGYYSLLATRFFAGLGEGALIALASAIIAGQPEPDRVYGWQAIVVAPIVATCVILLPQLLKPYGVNGVFLMLTGFCAMGFCVARWLPGYFHDGQPIAPRHLIKSRDWPSINKPKTWLSLFSLFVMFTGGGIVWPFFERIANAAQISATEIGASLGGAMYFAVLAGFCIVYLGTQYGRVKPILVGSAGLVTSVLLLSFSLNVYTFFTAMALFMFFWSLTLVYTLGVLSSLDSSGRITVMGTIVQNLGLMAGPLLAGVILKGENYTPLCWMSIGFIGVYICIIIPIATKQSANTTNLQSMSSA